MVKFKLQKNNTLGFTHYVLLAAVIVIAGVAGTGYFVYSKSSAATPGVCGKNYASFTSKSNGPATLRVFANGKNYCAMLIATGPAQKVAKPMSVSFFSRSSGDNAHGTFKHYVGPVYMAKKNRPGVVGTMTYKGKVYKVSIDLKDYYQV